jgi:hypothetical protein
MPRSVPRLYGADEQGCIAGALSQQEYLDGLSAAGFVDASVTFTHEPSPVCTAPSCVRPNRPDFTHQEPVRPERQDRSAQVPASDGALSKFTAGRGVMLRREHG